MKNRIEYVDGLAPAGIDESEVSFIGICVVDYDGGIRIARGNQYFYDCIGCDRSTFENKFENRLEKLFSGYDRELLELVTGEMLDGNKTSCELTASICRTNGENADLKMFFSRPSIEVRKGLMICHLTDSQESLTNRYRDMEKRKDALLNLTGNIVFEYDITSKTILWLSRTEYIDSLENANLDNVPDSLFRTELIDNSFRSEVINLFSRVHRGIEKTSCTVKARFYGEKYLWYRIRLLRVNLHDRVTIMGLASEINAEKEAELAAADAEQSRRAILSDTICFFNADITTDRILNFSSKITDQMDAPIGRSYSNLILHMVNFVHPDYQEDYKSILFRDRLLAHDYSKEDRITFEYRSSFVQGQESDSWERMIINIYKDKINGDIKINAYIKNIDEFKRNQDELIKKAQRDPLTGLLNKGHTEMAIKNIIEKDSFQEEKHAYIMIDLDNFKNINDSFGHMFGDEVIKQAAEDISYLFRPGDIVGRVGGDEFCVFMKAIGGVDNVRKKASDLCRRMRKSYSYNMNISCSIGIAVYPIDGRDFKELYRSADEALYLSKKNGKNSFTICGNATEIPEENRSDDNKNDVVNDTGMIEESLKKELLFLSRHDSVTGLKNRNAYTEYVNSLEEKALISLAIVMCDINGLNSFNKTHGTKYTDGLVNRFGERISMFFSKHNIFHLGGDNFCIIIENESYDDVRRMTDRFRKEINGSEEYSISVGYAWKEDNPPYYDLFELASNRHNADKLAVFMKEGAVDPGLMKQKYEQLHEEIKNGQYLVYLQPKINCRSGMSDQAEALIRKTDEEGRIISPANFIPALEKDGFIRYLDYHVLKEVYRLQRRWLEERREPVVVSVNMSRLTVTDHNFFDILRMIKSQFSDVPASMIKIEITESVGAISVDTMKQISSDIRSMGYGLSLDDFGSSYTNMSAIMVMEYDEIKLDRSMVSSFLDSKNGSAIIRGIIDMSARLGVSVVAEGVEEEEQLQELKRLGADYIQGYYFSKPVSIREFEEKWYPAAEK